MRSSSIDILTIGGFDPSNGAGITADVKTFEALGMPALSVQTCLTIQNESEVGKIYWSAEEQIREQLDILLQVHRPSLVKLSLTKDLQSAIGIARYLHERLPDVRIIWDPVMASSSGFDFYKTVNRNELLEMLPFVYMATPNWNEIQRWGEGDPSEIAARVSSLTLICLKGGHRPGKKGIDLLFRNGRAVHSFPPKKQSYAPKHGSGCVFASALTAYLTKGLDPKDAIRKAKDYIEDFLDSDPGLLGKHPSAAVIKGQVTDRLYYLTQDLPNKSHQQQAQTAIEAGVRFIQVRSKVLPISELSNAISEIVEMAAGSSSRVIINDHVELVAGTGADGVHLGNSDMTVEAARGLLGPGMIIGGTANTIEDIRRLTAMGANYIGLGPFRFTETKNNLSPVLGLSGVSAIADEMRSLGMMVPVYVIGGIKKEDINPVLGSGIHGVAVSSAINISEDPAGMIRSMQQIIWSIEKDHTKELMNVL